MSNDKYELFRTHPLMKVWAPGLPVPIGHLGLALATLIDSRNSVILNENRGLHWTDKRTGLDFYQGYPDVSIYELKLNPDYKLGIRQALKARSKDAKPLSYEKYETNLIIRSCILQIMNPIHRKDLFFKMFGEGLRRAVINIRAFMDMALDVNNIEYTTKFLSGK